MHAFSAAEERERAARAEAKRGVDAASALLSQLEARLAAGSSGDQQQEQQQEEQELQQKQPQGQQQNNAKQQHDAKQEQGQHEGQESRQGDLGGRRRPWWQLLLWGRGG